ncbi:hypothetical protein EAF00_001766 [Botryotinia globosa]|nr:hypothetical protein EAF00_001766 [Botryotinia globosa]
MPPKIIFLTGAPTYHSLSWDESNLHSDFTDPFIQFLHLPHPYPNSAPRNNTTSVLEFSIAQNPEWRELPLERKHLTTGASQDHAFQPLHGGHALDFFSATTFLSQSQGYSQSLSNLDSYLSLNDENDDHQEVDGVLSQFYEHSYAIHDIPSSQITSSDFDSTSYSTSGYDSQSIFPQSGENPQVPVAGYLTNLKDIPHAQHLSSIVPQTMTVNLIVGIISISEPRAISTRQGGNVSLVEILVGDETKSGFSINFWLSGKGKEEVKEILENLRVQDIVLMKNVALGSFRGKVHGQSLRKDMTKAWLMYREKIDRSDVGGCYGKRDLERGEIDVQMAKVKRVRDWVVGFVGVATTNRRGVKRIREELPPDTQ